MTVDIASLLIPLLLTAAALWALGRRVDVYDALTAGASEGLTAVSYTHLTLPTKLEV